MFERLVNSGFEVEFASHAKAILGADFPDVVRDLEDALLQVKLPITEIVGSGGGEAQLTQRLRRGFNDLKWRKRNVEIKKVVDHVEKESVSHENFKRLHAEGVISLGAIVTRGSQLQGELRAMIRAWAEREGILSFDDLKARGFKRPTERQEEIVRLRLERQEPFAAAWSAMFFQDKYGMATTHWSKLQDRISRGVGNPCPLVMIGLPPSIVDMGA